MDDTTDRSLDGDSATTTTNGVDDDAAGSDQGSEYPSCTMGVIAQIGDGACDEDNNSLVCGEWGFDPSRQPPKGVEFSMQ